MICLKLYWQLGANTDHNQKNEVQHSPHQFLLSTGFVCFLHVKMKYHQTTYQINRVSLIQPFQGRLPSAGCQKQQSSVKYSKVIILPTQRMHCYFREIPSNIALDLYCFDSLKMVPFNDPWYCPNSSTWWSTTIALSFKPQWKVQCLAGRRCLWFVCFRTVDGRNPANQLTCSLPHDLQDSSRFYTSQVVQDFFDQQ